MTGLARHLDVARHLRVLGERVEPPVDLFHHPHHLARRQLGALLVLGEIKLRQRLPLLPHVTELAAHAERAGKVAHDPDDVHHGRVFGNDFDVDERIRRELAGSLGRKGGRGAKGGDEKDEGASVHGSDIRQPAPPRHIDVAKPDEFLPVDRTRRMASAIPASITGSCRPAYGPAHGTATSGGTGCPSIKGVNGFGALPVVGNISTTLRSRSANPAPMYAPAVGSPTRRPSPCARSSYASRSLALRVCRSISATIGPLNRRFLPGASRRRTSSTAVSLPPRPRRSRT